MGPASYKCTCASNFEWWPGCASILCLAIGAVIGVTSTPVARAQGGETAAKPLTEKQKRKREERLRKELETPYRKWLSEDVVYIITDEERAVFKKLATDEEREQFIEQFWLRRDPTPDTVENEFKEEHYRRIAYVNEHFASGFAGWKTDRGRTYILYGPPDEISGQPMGGMYERPPEQGGGTTQAFPFEVWRYRYIEGIGGDIEIEFVDPTNTGEFHMTMDPSEKDALLHSPTGGLTWAEQAGLVTKDQNRFWTRTDGTYLGAPVGGYTPVSQSEFVRLEQFTKLQKPPPVKFKDLEATVASRITFNLLPLKARADYIKVTDTTVMTNITLQIENKDLQFQAKDGVQRAALNIYGRITTMSRRVASVFEDTLTLDSPPERLQAFLLLRRWSLYQKSVPLAPGMYRLNAVVKDVVGGNMSSYEMLLEVPRYDVENLASSSVILADMIERVPTRSIGTGQFVVGGYKVRPRMDNTFRYDEKMGIYLQLYNLSRDEKTLKPAGTIEYEVVNNGTNQKVFDLTEDLAGVPEASVQQVTINKRMTLNALKPGQYTLRMKVTDKNRNQTLTPAATFKVIYN
jgi:GWxTD domain-containing protein